MFWLVLTIGVILVLAQGVFSYRDGYLTKKQMATRGIRHGWSFLEHGGMWADIFIISPLIAYVSSQHQLAYVSPKSTIFLLLTPYRDWETDRKSVV